MLGSEFLISELLQQTALSHLSIAKSYQFDFHVKLLRLSATSTSSGVHILRIVVYVLISFHDYLYYNS